MYVTDVTRDVTNERTTDAGRGIDGETHTLPTRADRCRRDFAADFQREVNATRDRPTDTVARAILPLTTRPRSARVDPVARATSRRYSSRRISAPLLPPRPPTTLRSRPLRSRPLRSRRFTFG